MSDPLDNPLRKLISEIHRRSLWQVVGIYVVASDEPTKMLQGVLG